MMTIHLDPEKARALTSHQTLARHVHRDQRGGAFASMATARAAAARGLLSRSAVTGNAPLPEAVLEYARQRLVVGWSSVVGEPLPPEVADEAVLYLAAHPGRELEYMGRGRFTGKDPGEVLYLDRPEGRRHYAFRLAERGTVRERGAKISADFRQRAAWLDDPEARVVLSIGGGGYRLFAAVAAVKTIEQLVGGDRSKLAEVWGSSGGALLGYTFARGHALGAIDRLGYGLYRGERKDLPGLHLRSLAHFIARAARGQTETPELGAWVGAIDELAPRAPGLDLPFYALVSNSRRRYPIAFGQPEHIPAHCRDFLLPCAAKEAAAASMAVPFLFRPLRGIAPSGEAPAEQRGGDLDDHWFDGSVVEENPLLLPFVKWLRDRRHAPATTPKRLKIVLVNLNLRLGDSELVTSLVRGGSGARLAGRAFDMLDLVLDSKTQALVRTLAEVDGVEVMTATLNLGRMSFITRKNLPHTIRSGQIMEAWKLELYRGSGAYA